MGDSGSGRWATVAPVAVLHLRLPEAATPPGRAKQADFGPIITRYTPAMDALGLIVAVALVCCLVLPYLHAWAWCLADLRRHTSLEPPARSQWLVMLILLSVVAIPMYVSNGPGRERWDPRMLWWPWRR